MRNFYSGACMGVALEAFYVAINQKMPEHEGFVGVFFLALAIIISVAKK